MANYVCPYCASWNCKEVPSQDLVILCSTCRQSFNLESYARCQYEQRKREEAKR